MKARKSAENRGIRVIGSIGVILNAKKEGKIPSAKAVFEKIRLTNFRISDNIINEAIKAAGEAP
jgi:predicted nucleic acid-binding protein